MSLLRLGNSYRGHKGVTAAESLAVVAPAMPRLEHRDIDGATTTRCIPYD